SRRRRLHHQTVLAQGADGTHQGRTAPTRSPAHRRHRRDRHAAARPSHPPRGGRHQTALRGSHRVPAATLFHDPHCKSVLARAAARSGLGRSCLRGGAHGRRAHPPPAQAAGAFRARRPYRNGARRGPPICHAPGRLTPVDPTYRVLPPAMTKTLFTVFLWALAGGILGSWLGPHVGWSILAFGLLLMVVVSGLQLSRITEWVKNIDNPPPASVGPWDDILSVIYRKLRNDRLSIASLKADKKRML